MGCKDITADKNSSADIGFNRNIMGCKDARFDFSFLEYYDLIGT